ncbi:hypothetical protein [Streptomyces sp. NPDC002133]|uniref:hypothetical protein n=1 Tax=Streptomyces sp. NPDC002133 TaxID=3154409 RepID=UPI003318E522
MGQLADEPQADQSAWAAFLATYLSELHRDNPAHGCAAAALVTDSARAEPGTPVRTAFTAGLRDLVEGVQQLNESLNDNDTDRGTALAELSTLVGAVLLARASDDAALSRDILDAAHHYLSSGTADSPA